MKILITGVAGFIGSNLAAALLEKEYTVVGVDNMSLGHKLNIADFITNPSFEMHYIDIRDEAAMLHAAESCKVIVHLAAYKIPRYSDALDTLLINSLGSESVIKAALKNNAKTVAASTSDVYGMNPDVPFSETSKLVIGNPPVKRWAYAISKMFEEQLFFAYHDRYGIDIVLLRFFGAYGPNQNLSWHGGPHPVFIDRALDHKEIELHGDGQQTRCLTYISDLINGIVSAIENPAANNKIFNIGNTCEISMENYARLIWRLIRGDEEAKLTYIPYSTFGNYEDVKNRKPDITLASEILNYNPKIDLENGLKKTICWQVDRRKQLGIETFDPGL